MFTSGFRQLILSIIGLALISPAALAQTRGPLDLGAISIPADFDHRTTVLLKGEYGLSLSGEELMLVQKNWKYGLESAFNLATTVEDGATEVAQPTVEVSLATADGRQYVQIRVLRGRKSYTARLRVSNDTGPRPLFKGALDPLIQRELVLLREAHDVLTRNAAQIWPGWTGDAGIETVVTFPDRSVVILSSESRVPQSFEALPIQGFGGRRAYIDRSRALSGGLADITGIGARADIDGIAANLTGRMTQSKQTTVVMSARGSSPGEPPAVTPELGRLFVYVHEAFHCLQAQFHVQWEKAGLRKNRGRLTRSFDATADFAVFAEVEGEALLRAAAAPSREAALEFLKDAAVARGLKHQTMPPGAVASDVVLTRDEGTATYANIAAARLEATRTHPQGSDADAQFLAKVYGDLDTYIRSKTTEAMTNVKGDTQATAQRFYIYGAYFATVFDRVFPDWKKGFFDSDRTLDDVLTERLPLTEADRVRATERFASVYDIDALKAKHAAVFKAREDAINAVRGRQGRVFRVDVSKAQAGFDIRPRPGALFTPTDQIYPHGLFGLDYGSMRLVSQDTPMRFGGNIIEWVDTEPVAGSKGYELKFAEQAGDLYKEVTVTTKGFTLTAKAVRITDDGKVVTVFIVD